MNKPRLYLLLALASFLAGSILLWIGFYSSELVMKNITTASSLRIGNVSLNGEVIHIQPTWWLLVGIALLVASLVSFGVFLSIAKRRMQ